VVKNDSDSPTSQSLDMISVI